MVACALPDDERQHTLAAIREAVASNPIAAAPAELRHAVWRVWCCYQHLFPSPLPLAGIVAVWVREWGLSVEDAATILAGALRPETMAGVRFASDLTTALAGAVVTLRRSRAEAARAAREAEYAKDRDRPATPEEKAQVRNILDGLADSLNPR